MWHTTCDELQGYEITLPPEEERVCSQCLAAATAFMAVKNSADPVICEACPSNSQ